MQNTTQEYHRHSLSLVTQVEEQDDSPNKEKLRMKWIN